MAPRWMRPPQTDETGRLAPEERAKARRRVRRSLLALIVAAIAAGLLAYACNAVRNKNTTHHGQRSNDHAESRVERGLTMINGALLL